VVLRKKMGNVQCTILEDDAVGGTFFALEFDVALARGCVDVRRPCPHREEILVVNSLFVGGWGCGGNDDGGGESSTVPAAVVVGVMVMRGGGGE
jgi:hypothetical protein